MRKSLWKFSKIVKSFGHPLYIKNISFCKFIWNKNFIIFQFVIVIAS